MLTKKLRFMVTCPVCKGDATMYIDGCSATSGQMYGARQTCCGTQRCQIPLMLQHVRQNCNGIWETVTFKAVKSPELEGYYLIPDGMKIY